MGAMHSLSSDEKNYLLRVAREAITARVNGRPYTPPRPPTERLMAKGAAFVTLTENGRLRGCIGHIEPVMPLAFSVADNAVNAALYDYRFGPLSPSELKKIRIEVSVLSPLSEVEGGKLLSVLKPGVHGLLIRKDGCSATFLPQVWDELREPEQFLSHLCLKAGLPADEWKKPGMRFYIYTVEKFSES